jgi:transcriptional regulator with XRE-family HTH domain
VTEHEKAREWRERRGLSKARLAELTGYAYESIHHFEKGLTPPRTWKKARVAKVEPQPIDPYVWYRYKMCCAGVEALLSGVKFNW